MNGEGREGVHGEPGYSREASEISPRYYRGAFSFWMGLD